MTFSEKLIESRLASSVPELENTLRGDGKMVESLPLGLGSTKIDRVILPNGNKGEIQISSDEADDFLGLSITDGRYVLIDGQIVRDERYDFGEGKKEIGLVRRVIILSRIALGRVNHWEAKVDFNDDGEK